MKTERSKQARKKWRRLVSEQAKSGQSVAGFCRERGLCAPHFFSWKKRLSQAEAAKFVEVKVAAAPEPLAHGTAIEVRLAKGRSLLVAPGFDAGHLRALLAVMETGA